MFEFYRRDGRKKIGTAADSVPLGGIIMTTATMTGASGSQAEAESAPPGFLFCNGALLPTASYTSLHGAILYTFGGSGSNFRVPDYRNIFPVGVGAGYTLGVSGGATTNTHTPLNHDHAIAGHYHAMGASWGSHTHTFSHSHTVESHVHRDSTNAGNQNGNLHAQASSAAARANVEFAGASVSASGGHTHIIRGVTGESGVQGTSDASPSITSGGPSGGPGFTSYQYGAMTSGVNATPTVTSESNIPPSLTANFMIRV